MLKMAAIEIASLPVNAGPTGALRIRRQCHIGGDSRGLRA